MAKISRAPAAPAFRPRAVAAPVISPRDRLIVALDVPSVEAAERLVERLGDSVTFYKVGLELVYAGGLDVAARLIGAGKQVFLDLKLHDIPNTVTRATTQIARLGVRFLTVHAYPQTMAAAKAGAAGSSLQLLAVTVMTSFDDADLAAAGYGSTVSELVARRATQAAELGMPGLILSAEEAAAMRRRLGAGMLLVTPGIRPASDGAENETADQKRVMTPARAIAAGADYLVVGRPVTQATDPRAAAEAIVAEIAAA